jgi:hypothetical protein
LSEVADDQQTAVADLHLRQTLGVFRQLIAAGREQFSGDDFFAQWRLKEGQRRFRVGEVLPQLRFGALIHGLRGEALVAVVQQRLKHGGRQAVLIALLGGRQGVVEMRALFWPAGDLVQLIVAVRPGGQNTEHQQ